jgi:hypothetical protein
VPGAAPGLLYQAAALLLCWGEEQGRECVEGRRRGPGWRWKRPGGLVNILRRFWSQGRRAEGRGLPGTCGTRGRGRGRGFIRAPSSTPRPAPSRPASQNTTFTSCTRNPCVSRPPRDSGPVTSDEELRSRPRCLRRRSWAPADAGTAMAGEHTAAPACAARNSSIGRGGGAGDAPGPARPRPPKRRAPSAWRVGRWPARRRLPRPAPRRHDAAIRASRCRRRPAARRGCPAGGPAPPNCTLEVAVHAPSPSARPPPSPPPPPQAPRRRRWTRCRTSCWPRCWRTARLAPRWPRAAPPASCAAWAPRRSPSCARTTRSCRRAPGRSSPAPPACPPAPAAATPTCAPTCGGCSRSAPACPRGWSRSRSQTPPSGACRAGPRWSTARWRPGWWRPPASRRWRAWTSSS